MISLARGDPRYPRGLGDLPRPPDPLWLAGRAEALAPGAIAIVGTRRMTPYGERVARELAAAAARAGRVVVSGLAVGIDSAAHAGALDAGGTTVAVLGEGLDIFAPHGRRRRLAARIRERGCIVSEYPPLFGAREWTFARRNATIAALGECCVIVEAPSVSGALITAEAAASLGRPVYAVPGPLGSYASVGTNALIATGRARALVGAETLGLETRLSTGHDALLDRFAARPLSVDEAGLGPAELASLMLAGKLVILPDGRIALPADATR